MGMARKTMDDHDHDRLTLVYLVLRRGSAARTARGPTIFVAVDVRMLTGSTSSMAWL